MASKPGLLLPRKQSQACQVTGNAIKKESFPIADGYHCVQLSSPPLSPVAARSTSAPKSSKGVATGSKIWGGGGGGGGLDLLSHGSAADTCEKCHTTGMTLRDRLP